MSGIEQRNGCVWYYGNPAGYIDRDTAVVDTMLHTSGVILDNASPVVTGTLSQNIRIAALKTPVVDADVGVAASIRIVNPQNMGEGSSSSYWNPGMDGVRVSVVNAETHAVVGSVIDLTNQNPGTSLVHFGKVCKLSYNGGRSLSPKVGGYSCIRPSQSLPRIISSGSFPASINAIRSYFTDEQTIRGISGYVGIDFETLVGGKYKIVIEPIAYFFFNGLQYAMSAVYTAQAAVNTTRTIIQATPK